MPSPRKSANESVDPECHRTRAVPYVEVAKVLHARNCLIRHNLHHQTSSPRICSLRDSIQLTNGLTDFELKLSAVSSGPLLALLKEKGVPATTPGSPKR